MIVCNKSKKELPVRIRDRYGKLYTIYIQAGKSTELEPSQVSDNVRSLLSSGTLEELVDNNVIKNVSYEEPVKGDSIISSDIVESTCCDNEEETITEVIKDITEEELIENPIIEEDTETSSENVDSETITTNIDINESVNEEVSEIEDSDIYVCKICGNQYATKRGLNMHMQKSHPNN